jgi:pimeloyl-ACP methyl ester carboxylesterase
LGERGVAREVGVTQVIRVSGERGVAVDCWGDPNGFPVFLLHGTPGSRKGPVPRASVLYRLGVRLICYDRPGYGDSERDKGRRVASAGGDVLAIADALGLGEFGIVGRSGGGPHALACAALISEERLRSVAVLVGLAPSDAEDLDWFGGMTDSNVDEYGKASCDADDAEAAILAEEVVTADLTKRAEEIRRDPETLLARIKAEMAGPDERIVADVAIYRQLMRTYQEAVKQGADGWIDDVLAFRRPWGFALEDIKVPVLLWHGEEDVFSPAEHSRWLAKRIPMAKIEVQEGAAHFDAVRVLPRLLARLMAEAAMDRTIIDDLADEATASGLTVAVELMAGRYS